MDAQARRAMLKTVLESKVSERGDRFRDGSYLLSIKKIKMDTNRKNEAQFIVDFRVDEATKTNDKITPNAPKSVVGWIQNFVTNADMAPSNVVAFLCALLGMKQPDKKTMTPDEYNRAFNEALDVMYDATENDGAALKGSRIRMTTYNTVTKKGNDFLGNNWSNVSMTNEEIDANAATL